MTSKIEVIALSADWCNPCKLFAPIYEKVASANNNKDLTFKKINIDDEPTVAADLGVRGIPTVVIMKDGKKLAHLNGNLTETKLVEALSSL